MTSHLHTQLHEWIRHVSTLICSLVPVTIIEGLLLLQPLDSVYLETKKIFRVKMPICFHFIFHGGPVGTALWAVEKNTDTRREETAGWLCAGRLASWSVDLFNRLHINPHDVRWACMALNILLASQHHTSQRLKWWTSFFLQLQSVLPSFSVSMFPGVTSVNTCLTFTASASPVSPCTCAFI